MTRRKSTTILLAILAFIGLTAMKCGEAANDPSPEKLTGKITTVYSSDVPMSNGRKCRYGSFTVQDDKGATHDVCASDKGEFTSAKVGDTYTRG